MQSSSDAQLLRNYAAQRSEAAFAEIVARHTGLVYSAALRQVGSPDLAQDVAQSVFTDLARKAAALSRHQSETGSLAGWLYRSTRYAANTLRRQTRRREARERQVMHDSNPAPDSAPDWEIVGPLLDDAMAGLSDDDRDALLLRFFKNQDFRNVGAALGVSDDTAQKRVARALEKLRSFFVQRGITTTATGLSAIIAVNAVQIPPAGLTTFLANAALAGASAGTGSFLTVLKLMSTSNLKAAMVGVAIVAGITTSLFLRSQSRLRADNDRLHRQVSILQAENEALSNRLAASATPALSRPAPALPAATAQAGLPPEDTTNVIARMLLGEKAPTLTDEQAERYLEENGRTAAGLLAAFRTTGDETFLREAMEKFPDDPQVAFTAIYQKEISPEERRRWIETLKKSDRPNPLGNYLSALDYLRAGQSDQAVAELMEAAGRHNLEDYSVDFVQNGEEAYRNAGYPVADAKAISATSLELPHLKEMRALSFEMEKLAKAYREAGDPASAEATWRMSAALGQQLRYKPGNALVTELVGLAIEGNAVRNLQENSPNDQLKTHLEELTQRRANLGNQLKQFEAIQSSVSREDWISYLDRWRYFGEDAAGKWLTQKYGSTNR